MIAVETEFGRFEADTEREALKLSRAAKREAAKQQKVDDANREVAKCRAAATGYGILYHVAELNGDQSRRGWRVYRPGDKWFPHSKVEDSYETYRIETEHGYAHIKFFRSFYGRCSTDHHIIGMLMNGCGYHIAIWVQSGDDLICYSVGACEDQYHMAELPRVNTSMFQGGGKGDGG